MGTQAQQALERRTSPARAGSTNQRNLEGTRNAQAQALKRNAKPGHIAKRKQQREQSRGDKHGREIGDGKVGAGYGGMGHGPLAEGKTDPVMERTRSRADPGELTRQVLDTINQPSSGALPGGGGTIFEDPKYGPMARERGAEFANEARRLDRKINQAKEMAKAREAGMEHQLNMSRGKLEQKELERQLSQYAPTGRPPDQLAVDESGAFTGQGHQASMTGDGPPTDAEIKSEEDQRNYDHELRKSMVDSYTRQLNELYKKEYPTEQDKATIDSLQKRLLEVQGVNDKQGGKQTIKGPDGTEYKIGDKLPNGKKLVGINEDGTVEVE